LHIFVQSGGRTVGNWDISASESILEFASIGKKVIQTLQSDEWNAEIREHSPAPTDDWDSILGTQDARPTPGYLSPEPLDWADDVKPILPPFVTQVSFTVDESVMTEEDHAEMAQRYPGVVIRQPRHVLKKSPEATSRSVVAKPEGVQAAIFELDPSVETDVKFVENLCAQYPWASVKRQKPASPASEEDVSAVDMPPGVKEAIFKIDPVFEHDERYSDKFKQRFPWAIPRFREHHLSNTSVAQTGSSAMRAPTESPRSSHSSAPPIGESSSKTKLSIPKLNTSVAQADSRAVKSPALGSPRTSLSATPTIEDSSSKRSKIKKPSLADRMSTDIRIKGAATPREGQAFD
jgi:hypothetical protein